MMETQAVLHKRTRAEAMREKVRVELANNEDGESIALVLKENGIVLPDVKWDCVFPHWLVAVLEGEIVGCCQVLVSKPVGYVEFLFVRPSVGFKFRAIAMRKLIVGSIATLYHGGAQYVCGIVAKRNKKFADILDGLTFTPIGEAVIHVKRLR